MSVEERQVQNYRLTLDMCPNWLTIHYVQINHSSFTEGQKSQKKSLLLNHSYVIVRCHRLHGHDHVIIASPHTSWLTATESAPVLNPLPGEIILASKKKVPQKSHSPIYSSSTDFHTRVVTWQAGWNCIHEGCNSQISNNSHGIHHQSPIYHRIDWRPKKCRAE